jgi:O-antigen ligase
MNTAVDAPLNVRLGHFPWLGFLLLCFFLPLNPYVTSTLPIHDLFALIRFGLFTVILMQRLAFRQKVTSWLIGNPITKALWLYTLICLLSLLIFNRPFPLSAAAMMRWLSYLCLYYVVLDTANSERRVLQLLRTLMLGAVLTVVFAFYQLAIADYSDLWHSLYPVSTEGATIEAWSGRVTSTFIHFNSYAAYLNLILPFSLAFWLLPQKNGTFLLQKRTRLIGMLVTIACVAALLLTQSRGGLAGFLAILAVFLWVKSRSKTQFAKQLIVTSTLVGAAIAVLGLIGKRFSTVDANSLTRLIIWGAAWQVFLSSPWIGVGFGNFKEVYGDLIPGYARVLDTHNLLLQLLSETGIVGLIAFVILITITLRVAKRKARSPNTTERIVAVGALAAIMGVLAHGTVDYVFHVCPQFSALFFIVLALLSVTYKTDQTSLQPSTRDAESRSHSRLRPTEKAPRPPGSSPVLDNGLRKETSANPAAPGMF